MADKTKEPKPAAPIQQPDVLQHVIPAPVLKAAIDLIDAEIVGAKGRRIANLLEQCPQLNAEAMAAQMK